MGNWQSEEQPDYDDIEPISAPPPPRRPSLVRHSKPAVEHVFAEEQPNYEDPEIRAPSPDDYVNASFHGQQQHQQHHQQDQNNDQDHVRSVSPDDYTHYVNANNNNNNQNRPASPDDYATTTTTTADPAYADDHNHATAQWDQLYVNQETVDAFMRSRW